MSFKFTFISKITIAYVKDYVNNLWLCLNAGASGI